jgi:hypothetical protein
MGARCSDLCNKQKKKQLQEEREKDFEFGNYVSSLCKYYKRVEKDYNIFKYFQLQEFVLLLTLFHVDPKADPYKKDVIAKSECKQEMNKEEFTVFLENKILKNYLLICIMNEKEDDIQLFKDYAKLLFESLIECEKDHWRIKNPGAKLKKGHIVSVKKNYILPMGLLYCSSSNISKIDMLFELFSNSNREFELSEDLENFLFYLFITPSSCSLRALKVIAEKFPKKLDGISPGDYTQKSDALEITDIIRLKDIFITNFFKGKNLISRREYEEKFKNEDFGWIFSPNGIRLFLENNNDVKPSN